MGLFFLFADSYSIGIDKLKGVNKDEKKNGDFFADNAGSWLYE